MNQISTGREEHGNGVTSFPVFMCVPRIVRGELVMWMRIVHFLTVAANLGAFFIVLAFATVVVTKALQVLLVSRPPVQLMQWS
jgi:hypothetical protein